jgi:hypothetical protein
LNHWTCSADGLGTLGLLEGNLGVSDRKKYLRIIDGSADTALLPRHSFAALIGQASFGITGKWRSNTFDHIATDEAEAARMLCLGLSHQLGIRNRPRRIEFADRAEFVTHRFPKSYPRRDLRSRQQDQLTANLNLTGARQELGPPASDSSLARTASIMRFSSSPASGLVTKRGSAINPISLCGAS